MPGVPALKVRAKFQQKTEPDMFGTGMDRRLNALLRGVGKAANEAAKVATATTQRTFVYRRDIVPPRPGRSSTGGQMSRSLRWVSRQGAVVFDVAKADTEARHWIIQEIGTGERATLKTAGQANPKGRPGKGATHVRTVRSQRGRYLRSGLVFASGGRYTPTGQGHGEQIHWASTVGAPWRAPRIRIEHEIKGQHMVQAAPRTAFPVYRTSVYGAARQAFNKRNGP